MDVWERVQQYMVSSRPESLHFGPFALRLHPTDDAVEQNVAMPSIPVVGELQGWLDPLRETFAAHGRIPAIQWAEGYVPQLEETLHAVGFGEYQRELLLICSADTLRAVPPIAGLTIAEITDSSPLSDVREGLDVNELGFDPTWAQAATDAQASEFRASLEYARAFTAKLSGQATAAGMYTVPRDRVTQLVGITTLEAFRGQGIARNLTTRMVQTALGTGCDLVFLTTMNPAARRAYEAVGFQPIGAWLTYTASSAASNS